MTLNKHFTKTLFALALCLVLFRDTSAQFNYKSSWGLLDVLEQPAKNENLLEAEPQKNKDVVIAVIDSGAEFDHPDLKDSYYMPSNHPMLPKYLWGKSVDQSYYGVDFSRRTISYSPKDTHGHGTHVSGIIKQVYPNAKFLVLKYFDPQAKGEINTMSSIQALRFAVLCPEVNIINYSGGGPGASIEEKKLILEAQEKGKIIVAAAGNERSNIDLPHFHYYPASYRLDNIITVGAYNSKQDLLSSSNWGETVDISAPGYQIASSGKDKSITRMTGTSQATAFVSGALAKLKSSFPDLSLFQLKKIILQSGKINKFLMKRSKTSKMLRIKNAYAMAKNISKNLSKKLKKVASISLKDKDPKRSVAKDQ